VACEKVKYPALTLAPPANALSKKDVTYVKVEESEVGSLA
jgi:hypothetical protein